MTMSPLVVILFRVHIWNIFFVRFFYVLFIVNLFLRLKIYNKLWFY